MIQLFEQDWIDHGDAMCFDFRPASWWQRLPLVRHLRAHRAACDTTIKPLDYRFWLAAGMACGWDRR